MNSKLWHLKKKKRGRFIAINNNVFWPGRKIFDNAKIVHLIRHPKDIVISGYFYHKKGSELWNRETIRYQPLYRLQFEMDDIYNDQEKKMLNPETTYQQLLEYLPLEKGLMTEMVWIKYVHSFNPLPYYQTPGIQTFRFEEIMADPVKEIEAICRHWQLTDDNQQSYFRRFTTLFLISST